VNNRPKRVLVRNERSGKAEPPNNVTITVGNGKGLTSGNNGTNNANANNGNNQGNNNNNYVISGVGVKNVGVINANKSAAKNQTINVMQVKTKGTTPAGKISNTTKTNQTKSPQQRRQRAAVNKQRCSAAVQRACACMQPTKILRSEPKCKMRSAEPARNNGNNNQNGNNQPMVRVITNNKERNNAARNCNQSTINAKQQRAKVNNKEQRTNNAKIKRER